MYHPLRFAVPLLVLVVSGCSDKGKVREMPQGEGKLRIIGSAYLRAAQELKRSPKNAEELKPFLKAYGNPDELLISPNDGKPYVIVPGVDVKNRRLWPVLAYEQEGKNGQLEYVDLSMLTPKTASAEELKRLLSSPAKAEF